MKKLVCMRRIVFLIGMIFAVSPSLSQNLYRIDGESLELYVETSGPLILLWNSFEGDFRYFMEYEGAITELKNTRENRQYNREYIQTLKPFAREISYDLEKLRFTVADLKKFFNAYNKEKNPKSQPAALLSNPDLRAGVFGGITNSPFRSKNLDNQRGRIQAAAGFELELTDLRKLRRHAMSLQFKHSFKSKNELPYTASQISLNYRFKFIKTPKLDLYINVKFAALTFFEHSYYSESAIYSESGSVFNAPLIAGFGADYKIYSSWYRES